MKVYYRKGRMWDMDGYFFSTEYTDEIFYWGTLEEAKDGFVRKLTRRSVVGSNSSIQIEWIGK